MRSKQMGAKEKKIFTNFNLNCDKVVEKEKRKKAIFHGMCVWSVF